MLHPLITYPGELPRTPYMRSSENTPSTHSAEYRSNSQGATYTDVPHDDLEEALIRRQKGVYVTMSFQTYQRNVVGGCWERTEPQTRIRTGRSGCCLQTTKPR